MATHSSILAWKIPLTEGSWRVRYDWTTSLSFFLLSASDKPGTRLRAGTDTGWWDLVSFTEVFSVSWGDGRRCWSTVYATAGIKTPHRWTQAQRRNHLLDCRSWRRLLRGGDNCPVYWWKSRSFQAEKFAREECCQRHKLTPCVFSWNGRFEGRKEWRAENSLTHVLKWKTLHIHGNRENGKIHLPAHHPASATINSMANPVLFIFFYSPILLFWCKSQTSSHFISFMQIPEFWKYIFFLLPTNESIYSLTIYSLYSCNLV